MILTDTIINTAKARTKPFKLGDGQGMYLLVMPNGSKYFRLDYRLDGKRLTLALGVYPETSLEAARASRDIAKQQIKDGIKPKAITGRKTVSNATSTDKKLEQLLKNERQINSNLQAKLATSMAFSHLTKEQIELFFALDNPELAKLKALSALIMHAGIGSFKDAELVKDLERRGFEVSIHREIPK